MNLRFPEELRRRVEHARIDMEFSLSDFMVAAAELYLATAEEHSSRDTASADQPTAARPSAKKA